MGFARSTHPTLAAAARFGVTTRAERSAVIFGLASRALTAPASSFAPSDAKDEKGEPNASEKYGEVTDLELGPRGGFSKRRAEQRSAFRRQRRRIFLRTPSLPYWRSPVCCGSIAVAYPFSGI